MSERIVNRKILRQKIKQANQDGYNKGYLAGKAESANHIRELKEELRMSGLARAKERAGEHYGFYGTACRNKGQLDAGVCWKCEIKMLRAKLKEYVDG